MRNKYEKALEYSIKPCSGESTETDEVETKVYGKAMTFDTEGDMYEYLTGRRSKAFTSKKPSTTTI